MRNNQSTQTDEVEPSHPIKRLEEIQKQADLAAEDIDDPAAKRYARRAGACAESALVMLQGPDILEQDNQIAANGDDYE